MARQVRFGGRTNPTTGKRYTKTQQSSMEPLVEVSGEPMMQWDRGGVTVALTMTVP